MLKISSKFLVAGIVIFLFGSLFLREALSPEFEPYNLLSSFLIYFASLICVAAGVGLIALSFTAFRDNVKKALTGGGKVSDWVKGAIFLNVLLLVAYIPVDAYAWFNMAGINSFSDYYPTYNFLVNSFYLFSLSGAGIGTFSFQNFPLYIFITAVITDAFFISIMIWRSKSVNKSYLLNVPLAVLVNFALLIVYVLSDSWAWFNMTNGHAVTSHYGLLTSSFTVNYGDTLTYVNLPLLVLATALFFNCLVVAKASKQLSINRL